MPGPLDGVKVVELGVWIAGPAAGGVLADWGADVVKIEPPEGDPSRQFGKMLGDDLPYNPVFELDNRGKRSVVLDLGTDDGKAAALDLLDAADVFVTNVRGAALARLGLDDVTLLARNPRLVYGHITGFGREGPDADKAAFDIAAFWSRAGIAHLLTAPGGKLPFQRGGMGDHNTGSTFAGGICAALFNRERTGQGQLVSTSLYRQGVYTIELRPQHRPRLGPPPGDRHPRDDAQPVGQQLPGRLRAALLDRRARGRAPLAADRPPRRAPGVARRPALRHRRSTGRCTPPS